MVDADRCVGTEVVKPVGRWILCAANRTFAFDDRIAGSMGSFGIRMRAVSYLLALLINTLFCLAAFAQDRYMVDAPTTGQPNLSPFDAVIPFERPCPAESRLLQQNDSICLWMPALDQLEPHVMSALRVNAVAAVVIDQREWQPLYVKDARAIRPIASITKLMTAMVVLDAHAQLDEVIRVENRDVDTLKRSGSRLQVGTRLKRAELLRLALMASENRAAAALARNYPGGTSAFVAAMNRKARALNMRDTYFVDPTGLSPANVSTAFDIALMANAAYQYPAIRDATTTHEQQVAVPRGRRLRMLTFHNSNRLVLSEQWRIGLSKTGYIREAGRCLVMQSVIGARPVIIVLLDSMRKATRLADANYIREWLSLGEASIVPTSASGSHQGRSLHEARAEDRRELMQSP